MKLDEKKLYQKNKIGYNLVLIFVILDTIYTIFTLKNMAIDYSIGIFIITNILLLMVGFLAAVKLRVYSLKWSYLSILMGVVQGIRFFFIPHELCGQVKMYLSLVLLASAVVVFIAGIVSTIKSNNRIHYINENNISEEVLS
ncbi:hypothetical protein SH1V18_18980 [Vallitalea longa]|uniref:Uncharacterized protein n=1 Tax=Vallitalea longa TaxID=2936439 RepID=A0A9W6DFG4_9FIRM|nr:hypothetical protein [Vallitalea longa]GKX29418.1 hypothetical protein SH1V18_18980 [Vallitalea longa]